LQTNYLSYQILTNTNTTACSSPVSQEIPWFYGPQRFITTFITPYHLPVSSARSTIPNPPSSRLRSILILSSYPHLGLANGPFSQVSPTNPICIPLLCHTYYIPYKTPCPLFDYPNDIWWRPLLCNFSLDSLVSIKFSWHRGHSFSYMKKECMTETIFLILLCFLPWLYFIDHTRHQRVHILEWEREFLT
jgi:hypothetical protein